MNRKTLPCSIWLILIQHAYSTIHFVSQGDPRKLFSGELLLNTLIQRDHFLLFNNRPQFGFLIQRLILIWQLGLNILIQRDHCLLFNSTFLIQNPYSTPYSNLTTWAQHPYSTRPFSLIQQSPPIWISYSTPYSNLTTLAQHPYPTGSFSLIQLKKIDKRATLIFIY